MLGCLHAAGHSAIACRQTGDVRHLPPSMLRLSLFHPELRFISGRCGRRANLAVRSSSATDKKPAMDGRMLVFVPPHPLIKHWVSVLRNEQTPCPIFRNAMAELGRLLLYEASRDWLPTVSGEIQSPMGIAAVEFIDPREPILVIPILRAGLVLAEYASSILPATKTYHIGVYRDEATLQPEVYLNKYGLVLLFFLVNTSVLVTWTPLHVCELRPCGVDFCHVKYTNHGQEVIGKWLPKKFPEGSRVFIIDPMLATGGTIVAAINLVKERGVDHKQIKVVSAVAAPPALQKLSENFPGLHVYTGIIDPTVDEQGFIVPGLGDAGDRSFGT